MPALGGLVDSDGTRRFGHPLALVAARLGVLLDGHGAPVGHFADGGECVGRIVHLVRARGVAGRNVVARAESAWPDHLARFDKLCGGKHVLRVHRDVGRRRDAVGEVDGLLVVVRGAHAAPFAVVMRMHVHEAGNNRLARGVDHLVHARRGAGADAGDAAGLGHNRSALDDLSLVERDDARIRERDAPRGNTAWDRDRELHRVGATVFHMMHEEAFATAVLDRVLVTPAREESAIARELRDRELPATFFDALRLATKSAPGHGRDIDVVAFLERDVLARRRRNDFVGGRKSEMLLLVAAVGLHRHQRGAAASSTRPARRGSFFVNPEYAALRAERRTHKLAAGLTSNGTTRRAHDCGQHNTGVRRRRVEQHHVIPRIVRECALPGGGAFAARYHDGATVGTPYGVHVVARFARHALCRAASCSDFPYMASTGIVPRHERDGATIGTPCRRVFERLERRVGEPLRCTGRAGLSVDAANGLKCDRAPVGRCARPAEELCGHRSVGNAEFAARHFADGAMDLRRVRDRGDFFRRDVEPANLPALRNHYALPVLRPLVARHHAEGL